ncbi:SDR family NAD(P)-dependent oxidoreductase [uncultured Alsobacter sp.]|uniref:SDR family NAD(P)-dependent oxidoreductase n=1 Tax=uncultured Alsobacter sp. TaxID=1748258 RepID=UPI0025E1C273|nr:SDR family NAD(P)-dependent oxidoreductase [uncultured Alsobacter sp.]
MQITFEGRRALVTGAAHGIGRAIATALAADGADVVAADILGSEVAALGETRGVRPVTCDLSKVESISSLVAANGPFDILVHSAGGVCGQVGRPLEEISENDWDAIVTINMKAAFFLAQAVAPAMKAKGQGRMVMISSGAGLGVSLTGIQAYASAKAGEIGLTRQLAHELGQFGITVNSVAPGFVRSNPTSERQWQSYGEEGQKALLSRIATRRLGRAEDIASAVLFLLSDQASWISGQTLSVDGGK